MTTLMVVKVTDKIVTSGRAISALGQLHLMKGGS